MVTVNGALALPAVTVALLGTLADPLLLESDTTAAPEGAGELRVSDGPRRIASSGHAGQIQGQWGENRAPVSISGGTR